MSMNMNMNVSIPGVLEYMTIVEFKRKVLMNRYELGNLTKEETLQKLQELENTMETGINAFL